MSAHNDLFELVPPVNSTDHVLGPSHARVTIVEFGDFECPNCKQVAPVVKLLLKHFGDRLRFAFRNFPLEEVHPHALAAAQAAECAGAQGKFWQMHDLLFEHQHSLKLPQLHGYAESLELDMVRFSAEMKDTVYLQRVREHQESGEASGVRATPTFFMNGRILDVSFGFAKLVEEVEKALAR
jgi:protein-disulfide isomerase